MNVHAEGSIMLKAVIFDYNGVLVDDLAYHRDAYLRVAEDLGYAISSQDVWDLISATPDAKRVLFGNLSDERWNEIRSLKDKYYFEMVKTGNIIIPEAEDVLISLSKTHVLALVSNTARSYFNRLFPKHLAACFHITRFAGEVNPPKPAPEPLLKTMEYLSVGPKECCYVGDALSDVQMAKRAGVKIFCVATGHHSAEELKTAGADWIGDNLWEFHDEIRRSL